MTSTNKDVDFEITTVEDKDSGDEYESEDEDEDEDDDYKPKKKRQRTTTKPTTATTTAIAKQTASKYRNSKQNSFDNIELPDELVAKIANYLFGPGVTFDCDACPLNYTVNSLDKSVVWGRRTIMNPPFSKAKDFVVRAVYEYQKRGSTIACVVAARTNAAYWRDWIIPYAADILFLTERVRFKGFKIGISHPVAVVIFSDEPRHKRTSFMVNQLADTKYKYWTVNQQQQQQQQQQQSTIQTPVQG